MFEADKRPRSRAVKISRRLLHFWGTGQWCSPCSDAWSPSGSTTLGGRASCGGGGGAQRAHEQLALCADVVQGVVMTEQFMPMLMPLYLPDVLAARLQLAYGRIASASVPAPAAPAAESSTRDDDVDDDRSTDANASVEGRNNRRAAQDRPAPPPPSTTALPSGRRGKAGESESLHAMLRDLGPRQVMGALRHLLSQGSRAPPWFRQRAGRILSEIVLRPGGVQATLEVYLAGAAAAAGGAGEEGDETKACLRVAKLLATPPKRVGPGEYLSRTAPQLVEMLHFDGQQRAIVTRREVARFI